MCFLFLCALLDEFFPAITEKRIRFIDDAGNEHEANPLDGFLENMFIGLLATIGGIGLGLVFSKGILLIAENVLIIDNELPFYFPTQPILLTFGCFMVLFFTISLFVSYILRSRKLIDLIKGDKKSKGEPKANLFLTILAVLLLGTGYAVALTVEGLQVFLH